MKTEIQKLAKSQNKNLCIMEDTLEIITVKIFPVIKIPPDRLDI